MKLCDNSIELTKEQVKAALTSLISIHKQHQIVESRKRGRNKSFIEKQNKSQKELYNHIILSNITQPETMVLATSGLNRQQMVGGFFLLLFCLMLFSYFFFLFQII